MLRKYLKTSEKLRKVNREHRQINFGLVVAVVLIVTGILIAAISGQAQVLLLLI